METENQQNELLNISELGLRFGLDRSTVRKRLRLAGIDPTVEKARERIYALTDEVESALFPSETDERVTAARLEKLKFEIEIKKIDLGILRGEIRHVSDLQGSIEKIFGGLAKRLLRLPAGIARRLHELDSAREINRILSEEIQQIFDRIRQENPQFFELQQTNEQGANQN